MTGALCCAQLRNGDPCSSVATHEEFCAYHAALADELGSDVVANGDQTKKRNARQREPVIDEIYVTNADGSRAAERLTESAPARQRLLLVAVAARDPCRRRRRAALEPLDPSARAGMQWSAWTSGLGCASVRALRSCTSATSKAARRFARRRSDPRPRCIAGGVPRILEGPVCRASNEADAAPSI